MKIYLDTIGCRLNQSEIETYARQFRAAGHDIVADPAGADITVINSCMVTAAAAADSRKKIRGAQRAGSGEVVVTGCWATLNPQGAAALPGVSQVIPNLQKDDLVAEILDIPPESFGLESVIRQPLPGSRRRTRAFIKVQDGCDNRCTFCVTTLARGESRSTSADHILADIHAALAGGAKEIVLTGVHLGSWGQDLPEPQHLQYLVETILRETAVPRLRLSSLEPWDLDEGFFSLWENERLARHFHLPLQSGSGNTLRRMARKTTPDDYARLVETARAAIPDVAITTDVIVGFPGETEADFTESLAFVRWMKFAGGHVFTYSARPGTAAGKMPHQVLNTTRKERNAEMRIVFEQAATDYQSRFLGQRLAVLWESTTASSPQGWQMKGLTDNYLRVTAQSSQWLWNQITPVRLTGMGNGGLVGVLG
jgi:threonylcarbamoyladenosine tRNA methylthiotransferase MtaB